MNKLYLMFILFILFLIPIGWSISLIENPELNYSPRGNWTTRCCGGDCSCSDNSCGWSFGGEVEIGYGGISCQSIYNKTYGLSYLKTTILYFSDNATLTFKAYYKDVSVNISQRSIYKNLALTNYPYQIYQINVGNVSAGEELIFYVDDNSTGSSNPHFDYIRLEGITNATNITEFIQKSKVVFGDTFCDTGLLSTATNPSIRCDVSLDIPVTCVNTTVNTSMNVYVQASDSIFRTNKNNFTSSNCLPLTDCDEYVETCEENYYSNLTTVKSYDGYIGGETAQAGFVVNGYPCKISYNFLGQEGWINYGILGTLSYKCDRLCGEVYKCETKGLKTYSVYENNDCSVNETSRVECISGCDYTTGLCVGGVAGISGDTVDNATGIFLNFLLRPNPTQKFLTAMFVSITLGFIGFSFASGHGGSIHSGLIFVVMFMIGFMFFTFMGYIPSVLIILMLFGVGGYALLKNVV